MRPGRTPSGPGILAQTVFALVRTAEAEGFEPPVGFPTLAFKLRVWPFRGIHTGLTWAGMRRLQWWADSVCGRTATRTATSRGYRLGRRRSDGVKNPCWTAPAALVAAVATAVEKVWWDRYQRTG
jgi:hypothetical protein